MFGKKSGVAGSPLVRSKDGSGPSLFSSALQSKYMSPVRISNAPQKEPGMDKGMKKSQMLRVLELSGYDMLCFVGKKCEVYMSML